MEKKVFVLFPYKEWTTFIPDLRNRLLHKEQSTMLLFEKLPSPEWFFSPSQVRWGTERGNDARERREGTT
jgi:hypothetical protein